MRSEDEIKAMYKWIEEHPELGKVDVCIPNAGLSSNTTLLEGNNHEGQNPNLPNLEHIDRFQDRWMNGGQCWT